MAAVFVLILLPIIASVGAFIGLAGSDGSLGTALAAAVVIGLAGFVFVGALRLVVGGEGPDPAHH